MTNVLFLIDGSPGLPTWALQLISFGLLIIALLWASYMFKSSKGEEEIHGFFTHDFNKKLIIIAIIITVTEAAGLAIIAVENGMDLFNAVIRYAVLAFLELGCTFILFQLSTIVQRKIIDKIFEDDAFHLLELAWFLPYIVIVAPLVVIFSYPTFLIMLCYYQSIGSITVVFEKVSIIPWEQFNIVTVSTVVPINLGVIIVIYFGPFLNAAQAIILPILTFHKKFKEIYTDEDYDDEEEDEKEKEKEKKKETDEEKQLQNNLNSIVQGLSKIFNKGEDRIQAKLDKLLKTDPFDRDTHPQLRDGKKTVTQVKEDLVKLFLGNGDDTKPLTGLKGYWKVESQLNNIGRTKINTLVEEIDKLQKTLKDDQGVLTATQKSQMEQGLRDLEKEKEDVMKEKQKLSTILTNIKKGLEDNMTNSGLNPV